MDVNFRLSYLSNNGFVGLFPKTNTLGIVDAGPSLSFALTSIEIPAYSGQTQTISLSIPQDIEGSWVEMVLIGDTDQEKKDYSTITQFQVENNQLIITRLNQMPTNSIEVNLLFYIKGA